MHATIHPNKYSNLIKNILCVLVDLLFWKPVTSKQQWDCGNKQLNNSDFGLVTISSPWLKEEYC
jgi:hypothetical protein